MIFCPAMPSMDSFTPIIGNTLHRTYSIQQVKEEKECNFSFHILDHYIMYSVLALFQIQAYKMLNLRFIFALDPCPGPNTPAPQYKKIIGCTTISTHFHNSPLTTCEMEEVYFTWMSWNVVFCILLYRLFI